MKLGVKEFFNTNEQRCEELNRVLGNLKVCLEDALPCLPSSGSSRFVRNEIKRTLEDSGQFWTPKLALSVESDVRSGPYKIDWVRNIRDCECGYAHRIFLDLAFDNAQVVLTNLLKLSRAASDYLKSSPVNLA